MAGFFKKLFGGSNDANDALKGMIDRSREWQVIGEKIADDCFENGLSKGEIVRLSDITNFIKQNHSYNGNVVENGFLNQMSSYVDQGFVVNFNVEDGDIVFVHKDHVDDVLKG